MRRNLMACVAAVVAVGGMACGAWAWCGGYQGPERPPVRCGTPAPVDEAEVSRLRAQGEAGLREVLAKWDATKDEGLLALIDAVAAQRDAAWSRLFWHTDLEAAKSAARAQGKPILYLRLLGKLTDEYSCANSRYFRMALYADPSVAKMMRERFVLVWESERPVPVVTIDYGDGRVLKQTITGNSAHYVLDADGRVLDVLPGLIAPKGFTAVLESATEPRSARVGGVVGYWRQQVATLDAAWARETQGMDATQDTARTSREADAFDAAPRGRMKMEAELPIVRAVVDEPVTQVLAPNARGAAPRAEGKRLAEIRIVEQLVPVVPAAEANEDVWRRVAKRHAADARLSPESVEFMRRQTAGTDEELSRMVAGFEEAMALDSVRGMYWFRRQALVWLLERPSMTLADLNERVYAELFLTPRSDAWLGLAPEGVYTGLSGSTNRAR